MQNDIMNEDGSFNVMALKGLAPIEMLVETLRFFAVKKVVKEKLEAIAAGEFSEH